MFEEQTLKNSQRYFKNIFLQFNTAVTLDLISSQRRQGPDIQFISLKD